MKNQQSLKPEQWVDEYGDDLYRYACFRINDPDLAQDLVQDTFIAALHSFQNYSQQSSLKNWLLGILKHKIIDHFRKTYKEREIHVDSDDDSSFMDYHFNSRNIWSHHPAKWVDPRNALHEQEFWKTLHHCLEKMPNHMKHAFVLRVLDDLNTEEIRAAMNVTETNLGVILHRARLQMRQCLESNWFLQSEGKK